MTSFDCLLIHTPKLENFYGPQGQHMFAMLMAQGLLAVADKVQRNGYPVEVIHVGVEKILDPLFSVSRYAKKSGAKVIGLSLHWHCQSYDVIKLAREIKEACPGTFIVLGGFTASFFADEILRDFCCVDGVIRGDGELPMLRLVDALCAGKGSLSAIPNLSWRDGLSLVHNPLNYCATQEDMNRLRFANFHLLKNFRACIDYVGIPWVWNNSGSVRDNLRNNCFEGKLFSLPIGRGCSVSCSFCGGGSLSQGILSNRREPVLLPIGSVIRSLREALSFGVERIIISFPESKDHPRYPEELLRQIKNEKTRVHCVYDLWRLPSNELLHLFAETFPDRNRSCILLSPDSGVERVRRQNKGNFYTNEELLSTLREARKLNLSVFLCFTLGLPFESEEDIMETLKFQKSIRREFGPSINIFTETIGIEPGSPMFLSPEKYGIKKTRASFKDFVRDHSPRLKETPLGYYSDALPAEKNVSDKALHFENKINEFRCRYFCFLDVFLNKALELPIHRLLPHKLFCGFFSLGHKLKLAVKTLRQP